MAFMKSFFPGKVGMKYFVRSRNTSCVIITSLVGNARLLAQLRAPKTKTAVQGFATHDTMGLALELH